MGTTYDDIVYPSFPYELTHPFNINAVAKLFGMAAPDPTKCRVLELGCAGGGNLISMADYLPESEFVGIDLSAKQIELGKKQIAQTGLGNLRLEHASIMDVDESWGTFDYILCHGVYSWVPESVRDKILEVSKKNLKPAGIAYVSYNTYPGWHMRGMLREIMCFHAARYTRPEEQVRQSRMLLEFLNEGANKQTPYGHLLREETNLLRNQSDAYLYHEHLEENNQPCYFFEFAQRVTEVGLQYLGDSRFMAMLPSNLNSKVQQTLNSVAGTLIELEQYLDFLRNRTFRSSLLCHDSVPLNRQIAPNRMRDFYFWSFYRKTEPNDSKVEGDDSGSQVNEGQGTIEYKSIQRDGNVFSTDSPIMQRAMEVLAETWPRSMPHHELATSLLEHSAGENEDEKRANVEALLLKWTVSGVLEVSSAQVPCTGQLAERPKTSPVTRMQATHGNWVASRRHTVYRLDGVSQMLIPELDGTKTVPELIDRLVERLVNGEGFLTHKDEQLKEPQQIRQFLEEHVPVRLQALLHNAILVE